MPSNIRLSPSDINSPEFTQHFLVFFISPAFPVEISVCALYRKTGNFSIKTGASDNFSEITLTFASHLPKFYPSNKQVSAIYGKLFPVIRVSPNPTPTPNKQAVILCTTKLQFFLLPFSYCWERRQF